MSATGKEDFPAKEVSFNFGRTTIDWNNSLTYIKYGENQTFEHEFTDDEFNALAKIYKPIMQTIPNVKDVDIKKTAKEVTDVEI